MFLIVLTQISDKRNHRDNLGKPVMRRIVFGLVLVPLIACSAVLADDAQVPNANTGSSQQVQANKTHPSEQVSPPGQIDRPKNRKQTSITRSRGRSSPGALPLSSAEAYASEHPANLPVSSVPIQAPPPSDSPAPSNSWTGFHVGVGVGVQP
jgi:hypothetical protein